MKFKLLLLIMAISVLGSLTACQQSTQKVAQKDKGPVKIGFVAPLTGDLANLGIPARQAAELAVEEINNQGDISLELIIEDGQCGPKFASLAGNKLINNDGVVAIIGGLCSGETMAIAPIAEENKTVLISYASSSPKITDMGDYVFRDFPSDNFQGKFAADYVYNNLGIQKVAILNCNNDYCLGIKRVFKDSFIINGGEILVDEQFASDAKDFRTQLAKIQDSQAQLIYSPSMTDAAIYLFKQSKELNLDIPFFGGDNWDDPTILEQTDNAAEGMMWSTTQLNVPEWFKNKTQEKFGWEEVPNYAPQAYDAIKIIAQIIEKVGTNGEDIKNELYNIKDYQGVSGVISFDQNGDLENAEYVVKTIQDGKVVKYGQ